MPATNPPDSTIRKISAESPAPYPRQAAPGRIPGRFAGQEPERGPQHGREDDERDPQVDRQPHVAHARVVDQAALHHPPAHRPLEAAEQEDGYQPRQQRALDLAPDQEPEQRNEEGETDQRVRAGGGRTPTRRCS